VEVGSGIYEERFSGGIHHGDEKKHNSRDVVSRRFVHSD
jgi:hypothetical protein